MENWGDVVAAAVVGGEATGDARSVEGGTAGEGGGGKGVRVAG